MGYSLHDFSTLITSTGSGITEYKNLEEVEDLTDLPEEEDTIFLESTNKQYNWSADSTLEHDGSYVIKLTDFGAGRFIAVNSKKENIITDYEQLRFNGVIYSRFKTDGVPVITKFDQTENTAQNVTDFDADWDNKENLTYI